MNRALFSSLALHGFLLLALSLTAAFRPQPAKGMYPRMYKVRLVAAPQPVAEDLPGEPVSAVRAPKLAAIEPKNVKQKPDAQQVSKGAAKPPHKPGPALPPGMK
ncbi:MAG: hypothetical protein QME74_02220, partial [Candidatus Edwardsbacteria bacterium]|nr:hypothetical protein [Candidatus Edwardsbacteria bacterium]